MLTGLYFESRLAPAILKSLLLALFVTFGNITGDICAVKYEIYGGQNRKDFWEKMTESVVSDENQRK